MSQNNLFAITAENHEVSLLSLSLHLIRNLVHVRNCMYANSIFFCSIVINKALVHPTCATLSRHMYRTFQFQ